MSINNTNFILEADSYKVNHYSQIPAGVRWVQSSIVARKPSKKVNRIVLAGTQILAKVFAEVTITQADVEEAAVETAQYGYDFNREGWERIVKECGGKLPLMITALPEGTHVKPNTALVTIENTVPWAAWLPSYVETVAQRIIWKLSTVASISRGLYHTIQKYAEETGSPLEMVEYGLHNFGDRGADSAEAAGWAGVAHAMVFSGSDSLKTNSIIKRLYNTTKPYMSSVEATEHSTMCMNSDAATRNDFGAALMAVSRLEQVVERVKTKGTGIPLMSVVIDTYDSHRFVRDFLGSPELKSRIQSSGGKLVLRPDSGDPLVEPIEILNIAGDVFGYTLNDKGYKVLPPYVGVLQGDGINENSLVDILENVKAAGWATGNLVFGMGGGLVHEAGRDEFSFSQKATAMSFDEDDRNVGAWVNLKKEPITDRTKASLTGFLVNVWEEGGEVKTYNRNDLPMLTVDAGEMIYSDGVAMVDHVNFDDVRARARS